MKNQTSVPFNKLEQQLIINLTQDCVNMPSEHESEREKGFFTCAGSLFAILENQGLTSTTGQEFIACLDAAVSNLSFRKGSTH